MFTKSQILLDFYGQSVIKLHQKYLQFMPIFCSNLLSNYIL